MFVVERIVLREEEMEDREGKKKRTREKRTKEEMGKAYRTITLADMTRPARFGSTRGWKSRWTWTQCSQAGRKSQE